MDENSGGSGLVRYGKLQVDKAAQVQPGAAAVAYQPQEDLVAGRTAGDQPGSVVEHPHLGHGSGPATIAAAADGGADLDAEDIMEGAGEPVAVGPQIRAGHRCLRLSRPRTAAPARGRRSCDSRGFPRSRARPGPAAGSRGPTWRSSRGTGGDQQPRRAAMLGLQLL